jgi:hypothetical protein
VRKVQHFRSVDGTEGDTFNVEFALTESELADCIEAGSARKF